MMLAFAHLLLKAKYNKIIGLPTYLTNANLIAEDVFSNVIEALHFSGENLFENKKCFLTAPKVMVILCKSHAYLLCAKRFNQFQTLDKRYN